MAFVIPALFAIFAIPFALLGIKFDSVRHLRYFALAFVACGAGILVQVSWWPPISWVNSILSTALYLSGALLVAGGVSRRSGRTVPWAWHLIVFSTLIVGTSYFLAGQPNLLARVYILNFGFGLILLGSAWENRALVSGTLADKMLFWTVFLIGLHFFPRTALTAATFIRGEAGYSATAFWVTLQYSITLLSAAGGLALLTVAGMDIYTTLRIERDSDSLTGVLNRRGLENAVETAVRKNGVEEYSVVLLDLDDFKGINDTLGHTVGDEVLRAVASRIAHVAGPRDVVARIGGEEFVVLVVGSVFDATVFAERVRLTVAGDPVQVLGGQLLQVTGSLGVAPCDLRESFWEAVKQADIALYSAKRAGKNAVRVLA